MHPVVKQGRLLTLREFTDDDVDALTSVYGDPETVRHLGFGPRTPEQVSRIVARSMAMAIASPRVEYMLAAVRNDTSELIGAWRLAYGQISAAPPSATGEIGDIAQFGCAIAAKLWRQGYGSEGTRLLLGLAFDDLALQRVWGARGPDNEASAALMSRLGFADVQRFRHHIVKNGEPRDSIAAVLTREKWQQISARRDDSRTA